MPHLVVGGHYYKKCKFSNCIAVCWIMTKTKQYFGKNQDKLKKLIKKKRKLAVENNSKVSTGNAGQVGHFFCRNSTSHLPERTVTQIMCPTWLVFFQIVCFTSYFVFSIAVLPHSPGVVSYHFIVETKFFVEFQIE